MSLPALSRRDLLRRIPALPIAAVALLSGGRDPKQPTPESKLQEYFDQEGRYKGAGDIVTEGTFNRMHDFFAAVVDEIKTLRMR